MAKRSLSEDDVATNAELKNLPPAIALAFFKQESSSGRNTQTSPKGAVGAFQVTPDTFRRYMPEGGDIYDPVDNMEAGLRVIADGWKQSGGDPAKTGQFYYHGRFLKPGEVGPTSGKINGKETPTTFKYGEDIANEYENIRRRRGESASPPGMGFKYGDPQYINPIYKENKSNLPQMRTASLYGGDEEEPNDVPEEPDTPPDIAGLTRPLDQSMQGEWMGAQDSSHYELDNYVRKLVDQEFGHA